MTSAVLLNQLMEQAKEWQPLLASLLVVLASLILAIGIVKAAKIFVAAARETRTATDTHDLKTRDTRDLRTAPVPAQADARAADNLSNNLESLRSLLRSALSLLSSVNVDDDAARLLCARITAFQGQHFTLPGNADKAVRKAYATLLKQFETLQAVLSGEWSPSEASAALIQVNASARALSALLKQTKSREPDSSAARAQTDGKSGISL